MSEEAKRSDKTPAVSLTIGFIAAAKVPKLKKWGGSHRAPFSIFFFAYVKCNRIKRQKYTEKARQFGSMSHRFSWDFQRVKLNLQKK